MDEKPPTIPPLLGGSRTNQALYPLRGDMGRGSVEMYWIDVLIPILYVVALYEPPAIAVPLTKGDYRGL